MLYTAHPSNAEYCPVLCCTTLHCTVVYCSTQLCTALHSSSDYSTAQFEVVEQQITKRGSQGEVSEAYKGKSAATRKQEDEDHNSVVPTWGLGHFQAISKFIYISLLGELPLLPPRIKLDHKANNRNDQMRQNGRAVLHCPRVLLGSLCGPLGWAMGGRGG